MIKRGGKAAPKTEKGVSGMNYTISIEKLADTLKAANEAGYTPMIYINGEYYTVNFSENERGKNDKEKK